MYHRSGRENWEKEKRTQHCDGSVSRVHVAWNRREESDHVALGQGAIYTRTVVGIHEHFCWQSDFSVFFFRNSHFYACYTPARISPQTFSCHLISLRGLSTIACTRQNDHGANKCVTRKHLGLNTTTRVSYLFCKTESRKFIKTRLWMNFLKIYGLVD